MIRPLELQYVTFNPYKPNDNIIDPFIREVENGVMSFCEHVAWTNWIIRSQSGLCPVVIAFPLPIPLLIEYALNHEDALTTIETVTVYVQDKIAHDEYPVSYCPFTYNAICRMYNQIVEDLNKNELSWQTRLFIEKIIKLSNYENIIEKNAVDKMIAFVKDAKKYIRDEKFNECKYVSIFNLYVKTVLGKEGW